MERGYKKTYVVRGGRQAVFEVGFPFVEAGKVVFSNRRR
jgi:hypothetical protein